MSKTLYDLLGCGRNCTSEQIMAEYRARVVDVHPDKVGEAQKADAQQNFHDLQSAREILCDEERRKHYDLYLNMGEPLGISLKEWMENRDKLRQTLHWAQPAEKMQMLEEKVDPTSSCKLEIRDEVQYPQYPKRFNGWVSHTSPTINAFRNYQI